MEISEHELKGEQVTLTPADSLSDVPESHQHLLDAHIRSVFEDPLDYFSVTAARTPFPSMARWLRQAVECGIWTLDLFTSEYIGDSAWFWLNAKPFKPAGIWLPEGSDLSELPRDLREFFQLIGGIDWSGYGVPGGICSVSLPLHRGSVRSYIKDDVYGDDLNADDAFILGASLDGDLIVFTADNRGGWVSLHRQAKLLGTIAATIDWVFDQLCRGQYPVWNGHGWDLDRPRK